MFVNTPYIVDIHSYTLHGTQQYCLNGLNITVHKRMRLRCYNWLVIESIEWLLSSFYVTMILGLERIDTSIGVQVLYLLMYLHNYLARFQSWVYS